MKRCILISLVSLLLVLALPALLFMTAPDSVRRAAATPSPAPVFAQDPPEGTVPDAERTLTLLRDGQLCPLTMAEYLPGVLAGEMPASFETEALRAQAVAGRTYVLYHAGHASRHPEAEVCDDPACCQVWLPEEELRERWGERYEEYARRIAQAVRDTDGQILTYEGEPILSCFHSSSAGFTEDSAKLWGRALPYLVSVESPETAADVPNYVSTVEIAPEDFRETILAEYPRAAITETLPPDWLGSRTLDTSGRVASVQVGGAAIPGTDMRTLFGLRSACFTLTWTGHSFLFTVTGYGHGAGMSQYGANVMAGQGRTYREILAHYYPGTTLLG